MNSLINNKLRTLIVELFKDRVLSESNCQPDDKAVLFDILAELWVIWQDRTPPEYFDKHAEFCADIQRCIELLTKKEVQHA